MTTKITIDQAFELIRSERRYQDSRWNASTTITEGNHSIEEWIIYIERYLGQAKEVLCTKAKLEADPVAMETMRKVAGMVTACIEQHGCKPRTP